MILYQSNNIPYSKADLHIHSKLGDGTATVKEILDYVQNYTDLKVISITDHDNFESAEVAKKWMEQKKYNFEFMPGMEVTTLSGHLLALNIKKPIRKWQSLKKTIIEVHRQRGICIVPHPLSWLALGIRRGCLNYVAKNQGGHLYVDGIELFNSTLVGRMGQRNATKYNRTILKTAELGNSDAHNLSSIGTAFTLFQGNTMTDLFAAIKYKQTLPLGKFMSIKENIRLCKERNILYKRIYKKYLRSKIKKLPLFRKKKNFIEI
jgi:hypothetical protein